MDFNLAIILCESADASPAKPVAVYSGGQLTYAELDSLSDRLATGLTGSGLRPGDPVAIQLPNIPQFLVAYFGILKAGGVVVPMNVMLKAPEIEFQLSDSRASAIIADDGFLFIVGRKKELIIRGRFPDLRCYAADPSRPAKSPATTCRRLPPFYSLTRN